MLGDGILCVGSLECHMRATGKKRCARRLLAARIIGIMDNEIEGRDLGPLPQGDRNAEFQMRSFTALQQALVPVLDRLWLRLEQVNDKGVDASLEVKHTGRHTNLRAQIQMKSTDSPKILSDGTISLPIETKNLNLLLNQPSPLYVVYLVTQNKLIYAWARDERRRIELSNNEWMKQGEVSLHFKERITPSSLGKIRERILEEGLLGRALFDRLARFPREGRVTLVVDAATLKATDGPEIEQLLLANGTAMVTAGLASEVSDLLGRLGAAAACPANPFDRGVRRVCAAAIQLGAWPHR